tara:strand:+ start:6329 stop:6787 length:459 start_codon:yes stop_codon:yes gene_type:complete
MDFASALNTPASDVEKPPVLPQGTYIWSVTKIPTMTRTNSGEWDIVEFAVTPVSAEDDVDPDDLEAFGNLRSGMNRLAFMFPTDPAKEADAKRSLFRLKQFLLRTLRVEDEGTATIRELLDGSVNHQFLGSAVWRQDGEDTYVDVKNYAPID